MTDEPPRPKDPLNPTPEEIGAGIKWFVGVGIRPDGTVDRYENHGDGLKRIETTRGEHITMPSTDD